MARKKTATKKPKKPEPVVCPFVKFTSQMVHRSKLVGAEYNPRVIEPEARAKLKANIERVGLIDGPVWNKRTGRVVGGHRRLEILDALMKTQDYMVPVNAVDLDEKTEKEQNVFLNNEMTQGQWDLDKLSEMFKDASVAIENTGFTPAQVYQWFGDAPMMQQPEQLEVLAAQMKEARERYDKIKAVCGKRDDMEFYLVIFSSQEQRNAFLDSIGLPHNRYVDGSQLAGRVLTLNGWAFQPATAQDKPGKHSITYCFENAVELAAFREDARLPESTRVVDVKREG